MTPRGLTALRASLIALTLLTGCPPKSGGGPEVASDPSSSPAAGGAPAPAPKVAIDHSRPLAERVAEAADLIESGTPADLERAIAILEPAATEDSSGIARLDLGLAYHKRGDLGRASNQYSAVVATHPEIGAAWLYLGNVLELQGQSEAAFGNYQSGIRNDPENIELRIAYIAALRKQGRTDEAIAASKEALKINAKALGVYNNFGLAYLDKGNPTLAKFIFDKAVSEIGAEAENNAFLRTNRGWVAYQEGDVDQAKHDLQKAVELDPEFVPALVYLASIYMADHNYSDTVPLLETAQKLDPNNAEIQLTLGVAYRGVDRLDDARKAYEKALTLDPGDPAPHFNLGVLMGDYHKDYAGGIAQFGQYVAAGGPERALAEQYIKDLQREKELSEKRAAAEVERNKRDEERKRKEEILRKEEEAAKLAAKSESDCQNAADDDADTLVDCADTDCAQDPTCASAPAAPEPAPAPQPG